MAKNIDIKTLSKPQLRNLVKQISTLGAPDDTELAHITKGEMDLLKSLGGSGDINETTGIRSFSVLSNLIYGSARGKKTYKQYLDSVAGWGTYNKLSKMNLSAPKTFKELQDFHNRRGKFKGLEEFSNTNLLGFLKFKEGGFGSTYKSPSAWRSSIGQAGNMLAGSFNPMTALKENIDKTQSQILKDKQIASATAGEKLKGFGIPDIGSASVGIAGDTWGKGAAAQAGIDKVAAEQTDKAIEDAEISSLGSFTNLYG